MVIELEVADTDLIGKELKMKCSMRTDGMYFLLANKYSDVTSVSDHRVQKFYKQIFSSIALREENKIYIDRHGEMKKKKKAVNIESKLYSHQVSEENREKLDPKDFRVKAMQDMNAPSKIWMVQHYSEKFKTYIQFIQNDTTTSEVISITPVKYQNML